MSSNNNPQGTTRRRTTEEEQQPATIHWYDSLFDMFKNMFSPSNWDFGSLFMMAAVAIGGFFLAASDWGKDLLNKHFPGVGDKVGGWKDTLMAALGSLVSKVSPDLAAKFGIDDLSTYLASKSLDDVRDLLKDKASPDMVKILTKDKPTWDAFLATVKTANGGKIHSEADFLNGNTLFALTTTQNPALKTMVRDLMTNVAATGSTNDAANNETKQKLLASVKAMVTNPQQLTVLLNSQNRANTIALIAAFKPEARAPFEAALRNPLFMSAEGIPTATFGQFLGAAMTQEGSFNPASAVGTLLQSNANDPAAQQRTVAALLPMAVGENNVQVVRDTLGPQRLDQFASLVAAHSSGSAADTDIIGRAVLGSANISAFKALADRVDLAAVPNDAARAQFEQLKKITPAAIAPLGRIMDTGTSITQLIALVSPKDENGHDVPLTHAMLTSALLNADNRALIRQADTANVAAFVAAQYPEYRTLLNQHNLDTILAGSALIGSNDDNRAHPADRMAVLQAFTSYAEGDQAPLTTLDPQVLSGFFANAANRQAFSGMLSNLQVEGPQSDILVALRNNCRSDQPSLLHVLATPGGAEFIQYELAVNAPGTTTSRSFVLDARNLSTLFAATSHIFNEPHNDAVRTGKVLAAFTDYIAGHKEALTNLDPKEIASFFSNPANRETFQQMLDNLHIEGPQGKVLAALRDNWGRDTQGKERNHGLGALLANGEGAAFMKEQMLKQSSATRDMALELTPDWILKAGMGLTQSGVIRDNRDVIIHLKDALDSAKPLPASSIAYTAISSSLMH